VELHASSPLLGWLVWGGMLTVVLIISLLNLALQVLAAYQRHVSIREQRRANGASPEEVQP
jgi:hypothetical protein